MTLRPLRRAALRSTLRLGCALALVLALTACRETPTPRPRAPTVPIAPIPLAPDAAEASPAAPPEPPAIYPASRPALAGVEVLGYLPADTPFVVVTANVQALANRLGRRELEARGDGLYARLSGTILRRFQRDLLNPEELKAIGLSPGSPAGFAWLDLRTSTGVAFATVADPEVFRAALSELARQAGVSLIATTTGDTTVLHPREGGGIAAVLRGGKLLVVGTEGPGELAVTWAERLSELTPEVSLAAAPAFTEAVGALGFGEHAAGYLDARAWTRYLLDMLDEADPEATWEGTPTQKAAERALYAGIWGSLTTLAFGVEIEDEAVRFKVRAPLSEGSLLDRLVRATRGVPALIEALTLRPSLLVHLAFAPDAAAEVVRLFAELEGFTVDALLADLEARSDVDLRRDVLPLIAGEVGLAIAIDLKGLWQAQLHPMHALNASVTARLSDSERARALLDRLMGHPSLVRLARHAKGGGWVLEIPGWKAVHVAVDAGHLAVSTDAELPARLGDANLASSFVQRMDRPDLTRLLTTPDPALVWMTDQGVVGAILALRSAEAERAVTPERPEVPASREWTLQRAELSRLEREREDLERQAVSQDLRDLHQLFRRVGTTALHLRRTPGELVLWGGQFIAATSLGELVDDLMGGALDERSLHPELRARIEALEAREEILRQALDAQRRRDLEAWDRAH